MARPTHKKGARRLPRDEEIAADGEAQEAKAPPPPASTTERLVGALTILLALAFVGLVGTGQFSSSDVTATAEPVLAASSMSAPDEPPGLPTNEAPPPTPPPAHQPAPRPPPTALSSPPVLPPLRPPPSPSPPSPLPRAPPTSPPPPPKRRVVDVLNSRFRRGHRDGSALADFGVYLHQFDCARSAPSLPACLPAPS